MGKKFDVVIGNPPYQEEAKGGGTRDTPVYHLFMDAAYEVGEKAVLITPARFLFNAGFTPKAWNREMLGDPHLRVPHYFSNSDDLFPGTDIKGGIAVTYRDQAHQGDPIVVFTKHPELNTILHKVSRLTDSPINKAGITTSQSYRYTDTLYEDHPSAAGLRPPTNLALISTNTLEQFSFIFKEAKPADGNDYVEVLGRVDTQRVMRWIRSDYISGPPAFSTYRVAVPASNGSGELGEILSSPTVLAPRVAVTQTFITIGSFENEMEAEACLKYIKSKFARTMLGVLKVTQHNPRGTWKHVPLQDFTSGSDIDWTKSIPEIDQQLYAKYGLSEDEIEFIETRVQPME